MYKQSDLDRIMRAMMGEPDLRDVQARVETILERLVAARKNAGLSQGQVAQMLNMVASSVSHYESGLRGIDLPVLLRLCDIYDVSPAWVVTGSNPNFDPSVWYETVKGVRDDLNTDLRKIAALLETIQQPVTEAESEA